MPRGADCVLAAGSLNERPDTGAHPSGQRVVEEVRHHGPHSRVRRASRQRGRGQGGDAPADGIERKRVAHLKGEGIAGRLVDERKHVSGDAPHPTVDEVTSDCPRRRVEPRPHPSDLVEATEGARVEMITAHLAHEMRVHVERSGKPNRRSKKDMVLGASGKQVVGGNPVAGGIEEPAMEIEREPKGSLHDHRTDSTTAHLPVAGGLEPFHGPVEIPWPDEKVDVSERSLARVLVKPVLKQNALQRHDRNSEIAEPPRHVSDERRRCHRARGPAARGLSVCCALSHCGDLPLPGIKGTASMV